MQRVTNTTEINTGDVVLTGSNWYIVTDAGFPHKFRGRMWVEMSKAWGAVIDVPLPSPTSTAYLIEDTGKCLNFPPARVCIECGKDLTNIMGVKVFTPRGGTFGGLAATEDLLCVEHGKDGKNVRMWGDLPNYRR